MNYFLPRLFSISLIFGSGFLLSSPVIAVEPVIAIIIDDIGWRKQDDIRAIDNLPGAITFSVLPQTPNAAFMAKRIARKGKEVMLHIPMEATKNNHLLGPGALTRGMSKEEFISTLEDNFKSVPDAVGINNHMGSLLTNHKLSMHRLMNALQRPNAPFFIDSKTVNTTLPGEVAELYGIANTRRDVFLDHEQNSAYITNQFKKLIRIAKQNGSALAIAHPHPETIETLSPLLANIAGHGVKLITISEFMNYRSKSSFQWRKFPLSPSLTALKN